MLVIFFLFSIFGQDLPNWDSPYLKNIQLIEDWHRYYDDVVSKEPNNKDFINETKDGLDFVISHIKLSKQDLAEDLLKHSISGLEEDYLSFWYLKLAKTLLLVEKLSLNITKKLDRVNRNNQGKLKLIVSDLIKSKEVYDAVALVIFERALYHVSNEPNIYKPILYTYGLLKDFVMPVANQNPSNLSEILKLTVTRGIDVFDMIELPDISNKENIKRHIGELCNIFEYLSRIPDTFTSPDYLKKQSEFLLSEKFKNTYEDFIALANDKTIKGMNKKRISELNETIKTSYLDRFVLLVDKTVVNEDSLLGMLEVLKYFSGEDSTFYDLLADNHPLMSSDYDLSIEEIYNKMRSSTDVLPKIDIQGLGNNCGGAVVKSVLAIIAF